MFLCTIRSIKLEFKQEEYYRQTMYAFSSRPVVSSGRRSPIWTNDSTHFACEFTLLRRELTLNRRNLKQNEAPSAYAGSTNKGDNEHSKDVIFTRHASKCKAHNATRSICEERYASLMMRLWWSLCTLCVLACQMRVAVGDRFFLLCLSNVFRASVKSPVCEW